MHDSLTSENCLYKLWVLAIDVEAISGTLERGKEDEGYTLCLNVICQIYVYKEKKSPT